MALRVLPALALTFALLLAGCADDGPPADATAGDGDGPAPNAAADGPMAEQVVATRSVEEQALHVEGTTATGGCAYAYGPAGAVGRCEYDGGEDSFLPLEGGAPLRIAGTLTWTAATPASGELNVYILHLKDGAYWWDADAPLASGPSPLAFDFDLSNYNGTQVAISVSSTQGFGAAAAYVAASTAQDFVLDATYSTVVLRA